MHARTLTFLGGADTVTGSKYLLTYGDRRILVDAGMFQGEKKWREQNWAPFPVPPQLIGDILLTHAHADHCAYLPRLVAQGFRGPVWCTEGTRQLAEIVLRDSAKLQEQDAAEANERGYSRHDPALPLTRPRRGAMPASSSPESTPTSSSPATSSGLHPLPEELVTPPHARGLHPGSARSTPDAVGPVLSGDPGRKDHSVLKPREAPAGRRSCS